MCFSTGGNELRAQRFALRWAWLSLEAPSIDVDEDQGDLEVKVKRRGSLEHTAFVSKFLQVFHVVRGDLVEYC